MARTVDLDALKTDLDEHGCVQRYDHEIEIALEATVLFVSDDGMVLESDGTDMTETVLTIARHVAPAPMDALRVAAKGAIAAIHRSVPGIRPRQRPHDEPCGCVDCELWQAETTLRAAMDGVPAPVALTAEERSELVIAATEGRHYDGLMGDAVDAVLAKLRELRPELGWLVAK